MAEISPFTILLKDGSSVTIRHGLESDAQELLELTQTCILDNEGQIWEPGEFEMSEQKERDWIKGILENPSEILLLAEQEGNLLGSMVFMIGKRRRLAHCGEFGLVVLRQWRGKGLGAALLSALISWAQASSAVEKIDLRVLSSNERAIELYKKFGFIEEGRRARECKYADGTYADEVFMGRFV